MSEEALRATVPRCLLPKSALADLVDALRADGRRVVAPVLVDGVVSMRPIASADEIARGVRDVQEAGSYRVVPGDDDLIFQYVVGPDAPKAQLFPPEQRLFDVRVRDECFEMVDASPEAPRLALLGVRPCDLAAIAVHDRILGRTDGAGDSHYLRARAEAFVIVVNCTRPGATCFCHSMGTGPRAPDGFDLALTELRSGFVVEVGSARGRELIDRLPAREPTPAEVELADLLLVRACEHMGRWLETRNISELLDASIEHPRWSQVAARCLSCGNCTMVCPTCFCVTVSDSTDLASDAITRTRRWESCFTHRFSYTTAGPTRNTIRGRYRHWLRHKLGTWWQQFGSSGCVGCGRCITWCPVGIDLTVEMAAIRESAAALAGGAP